MKMAAGAGATATSTTKTGGSRGHKAKNSVVADMSKSKMKNSTVVPSSSLQSQCTRTEDNSYKEKN